MTRPASPPGAVAVAVRVPLRFERGALTAVVSLAGDKHWVTAIQLLPASAATPATPWQPPPCADPDTFTETQVTLGMQPLAVPGVLSLPHTAGPVPAVVLLAGSGPNDADETIGRTSR